MTDGAPLRRKLAAYVRQTKTYKEELSSMMGDSPTELDWARLQDHHRDLESLKKKYDGVYEQLIEIDTDPSTSQQDEEDLKHWKTTFREASRMQGVLHSIKQLYTITRSLKASITDFNRAIDAEPDKAHQETANQIVTASTGLKERLCLTPLAEDNILVIEAGKVIEEATIALERPARRIKTESTTSPVPENPYKLVNVPVPRFSGKIEDWVGFWAKFQQQVASRRGLDDQGKLAYLLQGINDIKLKESLEKIAHEDGAYTTIVTELHRRFDQPRIIHRKYCEELKNLPKDTNTREEMIQFSDALKDILNGFIRLKAENCRQFITTLAEPQMGKDLRDGWNLFTQGKKDIPSVEELIKYIDMKSAQAPEEIDKVPAERIKQAKPQKSRYKGTTNSVAAPAVSTPAPSTSVKGRGNSNIQKSSYPVCKYVCPLCNYNHYAWFCSQFEKMNITQKKEHVRQHNLCHNCLKPNHVAADCRSTYKCKTCQGNHNTLLHEERNPAGSQSQGSTHLTRSSSSVRLTDNLMMTSQVLLTGPTGMTMTVRALLDSGSSLSLVSTHAAQMLALTKKGSSVSIEGVGSSSNCVSYPLTNVILSPIYNAGWQRQLTAAILPKVTRDLPMQGASAVRDLPHIKDLKLADRQFDRPGKIDILLGQDIWQDLFLPGEATGPPGTPAAWNTVFGWVIMGNYNSTGSDSSRPISVNTITAAEDKPAADPLVRFFEGEELPETQRLFTPEEQMVEDHYDATHQFVKEAGRYMVCLPKKEEVSLGESRPQAIRRGGANEKSLLHKGTWGKFQAVVQEYLTLGHAEAIKEEDLKRPSQLCYYMPMHGVHKESSTTTKLRVVYDASALSTNHQSLNSLLAIGPTLHPTLDRILLKFRSYPVAISGDISKMYREVLLHPDDRHFHRFVWRSEVDQPWQDFMMNRVTFGVAASPYLAVKTLRQAGKDFGTDHPLAVWHINHSFYVDDLMAGADTAEEALALYSNLRFILEKAGFHLRKWRSSSSQVLSSIPTDLLEPMPTQDLVDLHSTTYPKALGLAWDSKEDTMATHIEVSEDYKQTKRGISSDIAKTLDVLGWLAPAILSMKLLSRELWQMKLGWDDDIPDHIKKKHNEWRQSLPALATIKLPRCYFSGKPLTTELHGFCDASEKACAAVIYVRATYDENPPSIQLVMAKTKIAPLKTQTIPRLELCGATLLARLMEVVRKALDIPNNRVYAWTDSTIVLAWLRGSPQKYKIFVANRVVTILNTLTSAAWKHVPTQDNPADCASRGIDPKGLQSHNLWWHGPPWLLQEPIETPH